MQITLRLLTILCPSLEEPLLKQRCFMHRMYGEIFPPLLYAISTEVHFNFIHYLFTWMSCKHTTFSLMFVKMPKQKRLRSQTKEVVANVYDYSSTGIGIRVSDRCHYFKQHCIIEQRHTFLHQMMKNCQENRPSLYLDMKHSLLKGFFQNHSGFIDISLVI